MEKKEIYTNMEKSKFINYIYELLYEYNNSNNKESIINPYDHNIKMELETGVEIIIPEPIRINAIKDWHNKKSIEDLKIKFDYDFLKNIVNTILFIIGTITFLYILSLFKYIVIR